MPKSVENHENEKREREREREREKIIRWLVEEVLFE
jgi:hypothetical protein